MSAGRSSSVRLRSALGKTDPADMPPSFNSASGATMTSEKSSRSSRRTNGHHGLVNGSPGHNNGNNGGSTSTRSQSRTRGNSSSGISAMEVDGEENNAATAGPAPSATPPDSLTSVSVVSTPIDSDCKPNNSSSGGTSSNNASSNNPSGKGVSGAGSGSNNNSSTNNNVNANETSKSANCNMTTGGDSNSMEVDESSSDSSSSDSSDSSDSEDSSEMDEHISEQRKQEFQVDLTDIEKQFQYLRELLYQERMAQITTKLEEVRSGKAKEYLGPLAQLQENMRIRMEVTASLRQFRLLNLQNKFDAEELAIRQNYDSEKRFVYETIKSDLEEKIRRLEEDRNNDFTSELWLETALKRKNKKSIDLFGDKKKKPVTVSGPYVVYMLNDVDIVEDWTVIKKALAAPKRKHVELVY